MKTKTTEIENAFWHIMESRIFRLDGKSIDLLESLDALCDAIESEEHDESIWYLGESLECTLDSLLVGAYWSLTEWHGGQYSASYSTLCKIGEIFNPGMSCGPEEESSEFIAYEMLNDWIKETGL